MEIAVLSVTVLLSLIYIVGGIYYSYMFLRKGEHRPFEIVDLDVTSYSDSISFHIDPVQVYCIRNELNISLLGLTVDSEIRIETITGEVIYAKKTDKCYEKIALKTSNWKSGTYVFKYLDAATCHNKYITGVFKV